MTVMEFPPFFHFSHKAHICWPPGFDKRSLSLAQAAQALSEKDSSKDVYTMNNSLFFQITWILILREALILVVRYMLDTKNDYKPL